MAPTATIQPCVSANEHVVIIWDQGPTSTELTCTHGLDGWAWYPPQGMGCPPGIAGCQTMPGPVQATTSPPAARQTSTQQTGTTHIVLGFVVGLTLVVSLIGLIIRVPWYRMARTIRGLGRRPHHHTS